MRDAPVRNAGRENCAAGGNKFFRRRFEGDIVTEVVE
jgi:hypothetical protein